MDFEGEVAWDAETGKAPLPPGMAHGSLSNSERRGDLGGDKMQHLKMFS